LKEYNKLGENTMEIFSLCVIIFFVGIPLKYFLRYLKKVFKSTSSAKAQQVYYFMG
jgi:hypothetical protein